MNNNVYLAGPDVFLKDPNSYFAELKQICYNYGLVGLSPFDNETFDGELFSKSHSKSIFYSNTELIQKCSYVVANLIPFRGACVDDGTSWEMGYAYGQHKIIYGYTPFFDKTLPEVTDLLYKNDVVYPTVETFGNNAVNLMLQESIEFSGGKIFQTFEECIKDISNRRKKLEISYNGEQ